MLPGVWTTECDNDDSLVGSRRHHGGVPKAAAAHVLLPRCDVTRVSGILPLLLWDGWVVWAPHGLVATFSLCRRPLKLRWRLGHDGFCFDVNAYIFPPEVPEIGHAARAGGK